jgi:hypothetical protein
MSIDPKAVTIPDLERLEVWLRAHLPREAAQLGQEEFDGRLTGTPRTPPDYEERFPWLFGRRFIVSVALPPLLGALLGVGCWAYVQTNFPNLGPVEVTGPNAPIGPIRLESAADWALFTGLPGVPATLVFFGLLRFIVWENRYTYRDFYGPSESAPREHP